MPLSTQSAGGLAGKRLLIFDDGLRSITGHYYEYDRATAALHRELGVEVTLICHHTLVDRAGLEAEGATVLPLIERSHWAGGIDRKGGELATMATQARYYAGLLHRHLADQRYDLVFVPNALIFDALAWAILRLTPRARRIGRVVLLFRFSTPGVGPDLSQPIARKFLIWKMIFRTLAGAVRRGQVAFVTDSLRLVREYRRVGGIAPEVIPSPRVLPFATRHAVARDGDVRFAMIGYSTWQRGVDRFEAAIAVLLDRHEAQTAQFLIQRYAEVRTPQGVVLTPPPGLADSSRVSFITRPLDSKEYEAQFDTIDCMVLPYRREHYHAQISGVAIEAACAGIPMIYTADTWLEDFVAEQGAGIAVADGDADALAAAIRTMADNFPAYKELALERSAVARARNSSEAFAKVLWGTAADAQFAEDAP